MSKNISFKQVLGIAFKNWSLNQCTSMVEAMNENPDKKYKLAGRVGKYVALKKWGIVLKSKKELEEEFGVEYKCPNWEVGYDLG